MPHALTTSPVSTDENSNLRSTASLVALIVGPVLMAMGLEPLWLGIMIALNLQISYLILPFGFSQFQAFVA